jgi:hypothetical protein
MDVRADATFSIFQQGMSIEGTYTIDGDAIILKAPRMRGVQRGRIADGTIVDPDGTVWKKAVGPADAASAIPQSIPVAEISAGPSMKETEAWIKHELPPMGTDRIVVSNGTNRFETNYKIEKAVLSDCRFTLRFVNDIYSGPNNEPLTRRVDVSTATLKDVDVSKIVPRESELSTGYTASKSCYLVPLIAIPDRGEPFTVDFGLSGVKKAKAISVQVGDQEMATQLADVLRRAAFLCGAPDQPVEASAGRSDRATKATPTTTGAPKLTNADVIAMVAAGLSAEVIVKSIGMASSTDFDVTPTGLIALKKAKVPDGVISAMQDSGAIGSGDKGKDVKAPSKYDPSLAAPPKAVAAPAAQGPCAGVELMGLYKEDMRPVSPLIIYLAKIRNSTNVTRIVTLQWMNMYTEEFRSTAEIGAGQIATLRLAAQEPFQRQPTNLRITACR